MNGIFTKMTPMGGGFSTARNRLRTLPNRENTSLIQGKGGCIEAKMNQHSNFLSQTRLSGFSRGNRLRAFPMHEKIFLTLI